MENLDPGSYCCLLFFPRVLFETTGLTPRTRRKRREEEEEEEEDYHSR